MSDNEDIKNNEENVTAEESNDSNIPGSMLNIAQELLPVSLEAEAFSFL